MRRGSGRPDGSSGTGYKAGTVTWYGGGPAVVGRKCVTLWRVEDQVL